MEWWKSLKHTSHVEGWFTIYARPHMFKTSQSSPKFWHMHSMQGNSKKDLMSILVFQCTRSYQHWCMADMMHHKTLHHIVNPAIRETYIPRNRWSQLKPQLEEQRQRQTVWTLVPQFRKRIRDHQPFQTCTSSEQAWSRGTWQGTWTGHWLLKTHTFQR